MPKLLVTVVETIVITLTAIVTVTVTLAVALRVLAGGSLLLSDELGRYGMIWVAMLGSALLLRERGHLRITLLIDLLPPAGKRVLAILSELLMLIYCAGLAYATLRLMPQFEQQKTVSLGVSMAWIYASFIVSAFLMGLVSAGRLLARIRDDSNPIPGSE